MAECTKDQQIFDAIREQIGEFHQKQMAGHGHHHGHHGEGHHCDCHGHHDEGHGHHHGEGHHCGCHGHHGEGHHARRNEDGTKKEFNFHEVHKPLYEGLTDEEKDQLIDLLGKAKLTWQG